MWHASAAAHLSAFTKHWQFRCLGRVRVSPWTRSNTGCWRRVLLARAGVGQGGGTSAARLLTCTCVTSVLVPGPDHCTGDHRALPTVHWRLEATLQLKLLLTTLHVTLTVESLPHSAGGTLLHCSSQMSMCVSAIDIYWQKRQEMKVSTPLVQSQYQHLSRSVQYCKGALLQDY